MGADTAAVLEDVQLLRVETKLVRRGRLLFGLSGNMRALSLLRYDFAPPKRRTADRDRYVCRDVVEEIRRAVASSGMLKIENGVESWGCELLVGYEGALYYVDGQLAAVRVVGDYYAVGCASMSALAALTATRGMAPEERVKVVLSAVAAHWTVIRAPFTMEVLKK